jgi:hypothetical protein
VKVLISSYGFFGRACGCLPYELRTGLTEQVRRSVNPSQLIFGKA